MRSRPPAETLQMIINKRNRVRAHSNVEPEEYASMAAEALDYIASRAILGLPIAEKMEAFQDGHTIPEGGTLGDILAVLQGAANPMTSRADILRASRAILAKYRKEE